jgi:hypothetical protein
VENGQQNDRRERRRRLLQRFSGPLMKFSHNIINILNYFISLRRSEAGRGANVPFNAIWPQRHKSAVQAILVALISVCYDQHHKEG